VGDRGMGGAGVTSRNDREPRACDERRGGVAAPGRGEDTLPGRVKTGATVGAGSVVGPGLTIGAYAMVGMGAVVTADVPPHALVVGNPARVRGWVCTCGRPLPDAPGARPSCEHRSVTS